MTRVIKNKYFLLLLLLFYTVVGIYLSIVTGITSDESGEARNWIINLSYIQMDEKNRKAKLIRVPKFSEVPYPTIMEPNLVIEYYSR